MFRKVVLLIAISTIGTIFIIPNSHSLNNNINFDINNEKTKNIISEFNKEYEIKKDISDTNNTQLNNEITKISRKITYLLIGAPNQKNTDYEEYAKRKKELFALRYAPEIPKNTDGSLDSDTQEYKDDLFTGLNIPGIFKLLTEKNIQYKGYGITKVIGSEDSIYALTYINDVKINTPNESNPRKIDNISTNLKLFYVFKKIGNEYKIYYIYGETTDTASNFVDDMSSIELNNGVSSGKFIPDNIESFDYSKLINLDNNIISGVYGNHSDSVVKIIFSDVDKESSSGVGFYVASGIIATSWSLINESLDNYGYISIVDKDNKAHEIDGIVTANPDIDVAIIKLKQETGEGVSYDDMSLYKKGDPIISISSKTGYGFSAIAGISATINNETMESILPSTDSDRGSPIFSTDGKLISMTINRPINSNFSTSINSKYFKYFQENISSIKFSDIKTVKVSYLKEKYYYKKVKNEELVNKLSKSQIDELSKILDIKNTVPLDLKQTSYYDGIYGLRYKKSSNEPMNNSAFLMAISSLISKGYSRTYNSENKIILVNKSHQITILSKPEYIILIINKR